MRSKVMMACDKQDIERAAHSMIANHGGAAAAIARHRALSLVKSEALEAQVTWLRIGAAIGEIQRRPGAVSTTRH